MKKLFTGVLLYLVSFIERKFPDKKVHTQAEWDALVLRVKNLEEGQAQLRLALGFTGTTKNPFER